MASWPPRFFAARDGERFVVREQFGAGMKNTKVVSKFASLAAARKEAKRLNGSR